MASGTEGVDRWIISILLAALSAVLWYLLLDTRNMVNALEDRIFENSKIIVELKSKVEHLQKH